jgi:2-oxoglutarate/2-oxoacid ferredoxin oxidoreductase subunit beta
MYRNNLSIKDALKKAVVELGIESTNLAVVSGVNQPTKSPHYFNINIFDKLRDRVIAIASGIKNSNPNMVVIAESDNYLLDESNDNFLRAIKNNVNIVHLLQNNLDKNFAKQLDEENCNVLNPAAIAIAQQATFVARVDATNHDACKEIIKAAIKHQGFALIDVIMPNSMINCKTYYLHANYDNSDRNRAFDIAIEQDKLALGIIYCSNTIPFSKKHRSSYNTMPAPIYIDQQALGRLRSIINGI